MHSDLLEHAMVRKSWYEWTGRCTGYEFARGVGKNGIIFFLSLPEITVVYSNLLFNIPQYRMRVSCACASVYRNWQATGITRVPFREMDQGRLNLFLKESTEEKLSKYKEILRTTSRSVPTGLVSML